MRIRSLNCMAAVIAVTALVFLLLAAGCITQPAAEPVVSTPTTTVQTIATTMTTPMTVVPTPTGEATNSQDDRLFIDAAEACYNTTPVVMDLPSHLAFATCMKETPFPSSNCAQNFRYYVLKSTNEDPTTAGFARVTTTARLAREAFLRGEGYDGIRQEYAPCGDATRIVTSFHK